MRLFLKQSRTFKKQPLASDRKSFEVIQVPWNAFKAI